MRNMPNVSGLDPTYIDIEHSLPRLHISEEYIAQITRTLSILYAQEKVHIKKWVQSCLRLKRQIFLAPLGLEFWDDALKSVHKNASTRKRKYEP